jgi:hypothetical protein
MRKWKLYTLLVPVIFGLGSLAPTLVAQDGTAPEQEVKKADERKELQKQPDEDSLSKPMEVYRVEFTITELVDNKKINTRTYSLVAQQGMLNKLRIGGRMPMATSGGGPNNLPAQYQYFDVGVNIDCTVREREGLVLLSSVIDLSSVSPQRDDQTHQPVVRQVRSEVRTALSPGKPTVISGMDDPTTKARFEFEVVAARAK